MAITAVIVIVSPPAGESSLKLISSIDKSGSPSSAKVFIADNGNNSMASTIAVILRDIVTPEIWLSSIDIKVCLHPTGVNFME